MVLTVLGVCLEWDTCARLQPCSNSRYGQSWGGWMEYCVVLSSLLSVSSLSDSSPSRLPLGLGGQRVSVLAGSPPSPSEGTAGPWMWFWSGLVFGCAKVWLSLSSSWHFSWTVSCIVTASESKRSISLLLLHSLWLRPMVLSIRVEVTLERLFCSFRAWALIPKRGKNKQHHWELDWTSVFKRVKTELLYNYVKYVGNVMECSDRATPFFFFFFPEASWDVCVCLCVFAHLYVVCLCQSQHWEAPFRKQTSVERKTELMEMKKKKKKKKKLTQYHASTSWHWDCRNLSQPASFIKAEHKTGRTLTPWPQLCQPRLQKWQRAVRPGHLHLHKMFVFHHLWTVLGIFSEASRIVNIRGIQQSAVLSCVFS